MSERRFAVCTVPTPACIGRETLLTRLMTALTKPVPDHLQLVGARFAGKTVTLTELTRRLLVAGGPYTAVVHWDLSHLTPTDDGEFMRRLKQLLTEALKERHSDYSKYLADADGSPYEQMSDVLGSLPGEGKVLAVLDGCDRALSNGRLTRNLWDQMRELGVRPALQFVTASRRTLRELIRNPDVESSEFFNIFEPSPLRVGCFDDQDLDALLSRAPELRLTPGAKTELVSSTNAYPLLALEVLNTLLAASHSGQVTYEVMRGAIDNTYPVVRDRLEAVWEDCPTTAQDLFRRVNERRHLPCADAHVTDSERLIERGFVHSSDGRLQRPNRLLARLLSEVPNDASTLARLFETPDAYAANLRAVFQRRLAQHQGLDGDLLRFLHKGLEDLPQHPSVLLTNVRGFVDRAFELIWRTEIPDRRIPQAWMQVWQFNAERVPEQWRSKFPQGGQRVRLLQLMVGTEKSERTARCVSRSTVVLMDAAQGFGDFGQHQEGERIEVGAAYSVLHICIELAVSLQRDLATLP